MGKKLLDALDNKATGTTGKKATGKAETTSKAEKATKGQLALGDFWQTQPETAQRDTAQTDAEETCPAYSPTYLAEGDEPPKKLLKWKRGTFDGSQPKQGKDQPNLSDPVLGLFFEPKEEEAEEQGKAGAKPEQHHVVMSEELQEEDQPLVKLVVRNMEGPCGDTMVDASVVDAFSTKGDGHEEDQGEESDDTKFLVPPRKMRAKVGTAPAPLRQGEADKHAKAKGQDEETKGGHEKGHSKGEGKEVTEGRGKGQDEANNNDTSNQMEGEGQPGDMFQETVEAILQGDVDRWIKGKVGQGTMSESNVSEYEKWMKDNIPQQTPDEPEDQDLIMGPAERKKMNRLKEAQG